MDTKVAMQNATLVEKRSGDIALYDPRKITAALQACNRACDTEYLKTEDLLSIMLDVDAQIRETKEEKITVEKIQDIVVNSIKRFGFDKIAEIYSSYRDNKTEIRKKAGAKLLETYKDLLFVDAKDNDLKRDNANVNTDAPMGIMLKLGAEGSKTFVDNYGLEQRFHDADKEDFIHIHDKDFSLITFNCLTPEARIILKNKDGKIKHTTVSHFDFLHNECGEENINIEDQNYKILSKDGKFVNVNNSIRRKHDGYVYEIKLKNGRSIKATPEHLMSIIEDDTLKVKEVKDLKIGDLLPKAKVNEELLNYKRLNLIDLFGPRENIAIANTSLIRKTLNGSTKTRFYNILKSCTGLKADRLYAKNLSLKEYFAVRDILSINEDDLLLSWYSGRTKIKSYIEINKDLGKFLGYVFTEGYVNKKEGNIVFANSDNSLIQDFVKCSQNLFPNAKITISREAENTSTSNCDVAMVFGKVITELFNGVLCCKNNSHDIYLGEWYKFATKDFLQGIIASEIDGDGGVFEHYNASVISSSEVLVKQLAYLTDLFNLPSRFVVNETSDTVADFKTTTSVRNNNEYRLIFNSANFDILKEFLEGSCFKINHIKTNAILRKDTKNEQIVSIIKEEYHGFVYDFSTEDEHFWTNGLISHNCLQVDLLKLFKNGFSTGHGFLREPNSIRAAGSLACIAIQSSQNDCFGGQSVVGFDYAMAHYVRKSFVKAVKKKLHEAIRFVRIPEAFEKKRNEIMEYLDNVIDKQLNTEQVKYKNEDSMLYLIRFVEDEMQCFDMGQYFYQLKDLNKDFAYKVYKLACRDVEDETKQSMEAVIHNFNTLHSRAGAQVPFSSLNYGIDTSPEGRLVTDKLLDAIDAGLGNGETPIFPISVYQLRTGINYNPEDPNYDLFKKACRVSAKRLFPNFVNLDSSYNSPYFKLGDYNSYVSTMG